jgi:hypothetical protein
MVFLLILIIFRTFSRFLPQLREKEMPQERSAPQSNERKLGLLMGGCAR